MALRVAHAMRASGLVCGCLLAYADYGCSGDELIYLDQGWSEAEREQFYYTTQGSQLIPYEWFLALERATDEELFRSDANIEHLGFLPARSATPRNPDRLPIGFVKDDNALTTDYGIKKSFLGRDFQESAYPRQDTWLGLTCAACHTSELHAGAKTIRIDGGSSLADTQPSGPHTSAFVTSLATAAGAAARASAAAAARTSMRRMVGSLLIRPSGRSRAPASW